MDELEKEIVIRTESVPSEYAPVFIAEDEFLVFGHVKRKDDNKNIPIADVEVSYGGKVLAKTNKNGFYSFKTDKSTSVRDVVFRNEQNNTIKKIDSNNKDWQMVDVLF